MHCFRLFRLTILPVRSQLFWLVLLCMWLSDFLLNFSMYFLCYNYNYILVLIWYAMQILFSVFLYLMFCLLFVSIYVCFLSGWKSLHICSFWISGLCYWCGIFSSSMPLIFEFTYFSWNHTFPVFFFPVFFSYYLLIWYWSSSLTLSPDVLSSVSFILLVRLSLEVSSWLTGFFKSIFISVWFLSNASISLLNSGFKSFSFLPVVCIVFGASFRVLLSSLSSFF